MAACEITLEEVTAEAWERWRELRLNALREAAYAFGSKLEDWQGEGDLEDRWRHRLSAVPVNVVASIDGSAAGMVSATALDAEGAVELISMWVAPFARGCGVSDALVGAILAWAREQGAARVTLGVFESNEHALMLYRRHGFEDGGALDSADSFGRSERRMIHHLA